jgi:hypothetical protein
VIPTAPGEGLTHMPHGSDWSSIREAGMKADKREAASGDAASRDGYGYAQEGHETVVMLHQRKPADTLEPKGTGVWASPFPQGWHSPHMHPAELTTLRSSPNGDQERSNLGCALRHNDRSRCQPQGIRGGIPQEAKAGGNASDMLT